MWQIIIMYCCRQKACGAQVDTIDQLTAEDFSSFVGKVFRPYGIDLDLVLATIDQREFPGWQAAARKPFSLILRGPRSPVLPEGHHRMVIEKGPTLALYIIPILTAAGHHQNYQIVFN
jgi:hypothetical protein